MNASSLTAARMDAASQSPSGGSTGPVGASRPNAITSGGGEKTASSRPGAASPTTPSDAAAKTGRTNATGSVGLGT